MHRVIGRVSSLDTQPSFAGFFMSKAYFFNSSRNPRPSKTGIRICLSEAAV